MKKIYRFFVVDGENEYMVFSENKEQMEDYDDGLTRGVKNGQIIEISDEEFDFLKRIGVI